MIKKTLTIAGSDSGGGAGIQADLKTFENIGVFGMSVITAVTAQNTLEVCGIHQLPAEFVAAQMDSVLTDIGTDTVKTGMLGCPEVVECVAGRLKHYNISKVIVDPVIFATSGNLLLEKEALQTVRDKLLPCSFILTPNRYEAEVLTGIKINCEDDVKKAARILNEMGAPGVLIKGGHFGSNEAVDFFYDGKNLHKFISDRLDTKNTHGTGCTLSSAIAAYLCYDMDTLKAIEKAKNYVYQKIKYATFLGIGRGCGPICLPENNQE